MPTPSSPLWGRRSSWPRTRGCSSASALVSPSPPSSSPGEQADRPDEQDEEQRGGGGSGPRDPAAAHDRLRIRRQGPGRPLRPRSRSRGRSRSARGRSAPGRCSRSRSGAASPSGIDGQVALVVEVVQRVEQRERPEPRRLGALQVAARGRALGARLLVEEVVGYLAAPVAVDARRAARRQVGKRVAGELPHARRRHSEHAGELVVGLAPLDYELEDRPLFSGQLVEGSHAGRRLSSPR